MGYLRALGSKRLYINLIIALITLIAVLFIAWFMLRVYTRHTDKVEVPDLSGMTKVEAIERLSDRNLKAVIIDSVYSDKVERGTVFTQVPKASHVVKPERKVYVTMNCAQRKRIKMPDLMNQSKRLALTTLELNGLLLGKVDERKDQCLDCVVEVRYKGKPIKAGTEILQGETVDLILGSGTGEVIIDEDSELEDEENSSDPLSSIEGYRESCYTSLLNSALIQKAAGLSYWKNVSLPVLKT